MSGLIRVVLDWETAYGRHPITDENITLSRMTTEEYVRHKHFKAHGLGVKIGQEKAFYVYGPDLLTFLRSHPWDRTFAIMHHAHFDGAIFSWRAGIRPAFIGDTLSMARAIYPHESHSLARLSILTGAGEKGHELQHFQGKWELTRQEQAVLGGYCCNDVELTAYIFNHLLPHFSVDELRNIDWTVRAFTEPVIEVDPAPLIEAYKSERRRKRKLIKQCVSDKTELASNDKFAALLLSLGVDPPKKVSPAKVKDGRVDPDEVGEPPLGILPSFKAPKGASPEERVQLKEIKATYPWSYAFGKADEDFKLLQDHPDPQVQAVVEARLGVKSTIKETRTKRFYKIGSRGAFPVYLNYYGGHTGRWCLTGDTRIVVQASSGAGEEIYLRNLKADQLVWDGVAFCQHGGLVSRGEQSVITHDGIVGTPSHPVFTKQRKVLSLGRAKARGLLLASGPYPSAMLYSCLIGRALPADFLASEEVFDILDCGPRNRFVANGKLVHNSGGDKQNAQNLNRVDDRDPTSGALRMSWVAPKGHVFVVKDQGQIEARQLVYLAGQEDMLDMFREGGDPYNFMATKIYGRVVDRKHVAADKNPGQVGKIVVLGAGFQMGAWKLQGSVRVGFMGMPGILFGQEYVDQLGVNVEAFLYQRSYKKGFATAREEADACKPLNIIAEDHYMHCAVTKFLIDKFRAENDKVVLLWREAQDALELILSGKYGVQVGDKGLVHTCEEGFILPNGMKIRYYGLRKSSDGKSYKYLANARKKEWTNIYGGKEVENCIAAGTKVLTDSGWKNIEDVSIYDLVHDGIDFVHHGGVVGKGEQRCAPINRVFMTLDHKVLTTEGWVPAGEIYAVKPDPLFIRASPCVGGIDSVLLRGERNRRNVLKLKEVYDIMNCGPLSRFVVLGDSGPFIVHNCVQALSRIILSDQMLRISRNFKEGYVLRKNEVARVVSSTHDEAISIVPERYASDCLYMMGEEMRTPPGWCKDIPLKSSGGFARSYGACEK